LNGERRAERSSAARLTLSSKMKKAALANKKLKKRKKNWMREAE
jgi:hypothetical protein